MLELRALPAREGDAIWIRWGSDADPHQLIIDMGTEGCGKKLRDRFVALPEVHRRLDLLVITHVDADHIGGVLTALVDAEPISGLQIGDVWFNGFVHLTGGSITSTLEPMGPAQGERLTKWLEGQMWNKAFSGRPVQRTPGQSPPTITLHDELKLTVLGPTPQRLRALVSTWQEEVRSAIREGNLGESAVSPTLESMGSANSPLLDSEKALLDLAESHNKNHDEGKANGTSIALLLEYKGHTLILGGDAYSPDLVDGIVAVGKKRPLHVDVFKLPHHGSRNNIHRELVEAVECDCWLFSTDGTRFKHPDAETIARILKFRTAPEPLLAFNVPSTFNGWWKNKTWTSRFGYKTEYGTELDGWCRKWE